MHRQPDLIDYAGQLVRAHFTTRPHSDPYAPYWFLRLAQALRREDPAAASAIRYFAEERHGAKT